MDWAITVLLKGVATDQGVGVPQGSERQPTQQNQIKATLTVRCWKSQARMMLVATLGKIPRFLLCFFSFSGSSSSPVLGEATLLSRPSPVGGRTRDANGDRAARSTATHPNHGTGAIAGSSFAAERKQQAILRSPHP